MLPFDWATPTALLAVLLGALLIDRLWGEPPAAIHPVVAMGQYLGAVGQRLLALPPTAAFAGGALAWCAGALAVGALAAWVQHAVRTEMPFWLAVPLLALLLKPLLAWRMLRDEVTAVEAALAESLDAGRAALSRIVSRDTAQLSAAEVRESAIETLAENLNDSVVAPVFWFALLGLPGAAVYRFANTADAMWGYRGRWEWAGKWAALADDALSWLPARLTAALLWACAASPRPAWAALAREAGRTASPNSGWPMATMALALGVQLGKPGVYALNADGPAPAPAHTAQAQALAGRVLAPLVGLVALTLALAGLLRALVWGAAHG